MSVPRSLVLFSLFILIGGCGGGQQATVSYDASANRTTYQTRSYTVSTVSGENYASSKKITMRAVAHCQGTECAPERVQLIFSATGTRPLSLSDVNGEIVADGSQITWTSSEANPDLSSIAENRTLRVSGKFAVIDLQLSQLETIATAESAEGSIGGQPIYIKSGAKSGFQELLRKIPRG